MATKNRSIRWGLVWGLALMLTGCARGAWWKERPADGPGSTAERTTADQAVRENHERALDRVVQETVAAAPTTADNGHGRFVRRKPYSYKEYEVYPEGDRGAQRLVTETESRTAPYIADVTLRKVRYATALHRKREDARKDDNYLRHTGTETLSYEYRNGKWVLLGRLFVVEKTDENVNGEWVPVKKSVVGPASPSEEKESAPWWHRPWAWFTQRD